jgi:hypothetical protein
MKAQISERALLARINRKLASEYQIVKKCRKDSKWHNRLGDYYHVDFFSNGILGMDEDLEELGTELGVLKPWEQLSKK